MVLIIKNVKKKQEKYIREDGMDWNKYNILGVIQARGGSKGIPKKNIKDIKT